MAIIGESRIQPGIAGTGRRSSPGNGVSLRDTDVPSAWTSRAFGLLGTRASRPHCHPAGFRPGPRVRACGRDARIPEGHAAPRPEPDAGW